MGKTRDLLKEIRDTKGTFHTWMIMIKDRNSKDLTEAKEIKKRRGGQNTQKSVLCILVVCTEELYKKALMTQITMTVWSFIQSQTSWSVKSSGP